MFKSLNRAILYRLNRNVHSTSVLRKKISKTNLINLTNEIEKATLENNKVLDLIEPPTGSVVLDTVREYTRKHPLCVLLVQVGDFYELYESHATKYASQLDLKLTKKAITSEVTVDFAGFPSRALDRYLDLLVNRLQCKVALCEQSGPVKRQDNSVIAMERKITRIITPGTVIEERFLDSSQYNYLMSINPPDQTGKIGLAWADISIGEFLMQETTLENLKDDLARIRPREVILPHSVDPTLLSFLTETVLTYQPPQEFNPILAGRVFNTMFRQFSITAPDFTQAELAAGIALIQYVNQTHLDRKPKWQMPTRFSLDDTVRIDSAAMTSLEIVKSLQGKKADSLLSVLDRTCTSPGSRLLTRWLSGPPTSPDEIRSRLEIVSHFVDRDQFLLEEVRGLLRQSTDAQRAIQRLALRRGQPTDLIEICGTLEIMKELHVRLKGIKETESILNGMDPHTATSDYLRSAFMNQTDESYGFVDPDFDPDLKAIYRELDRLGKERDELQRDLRARFGQSVTLQTENGSYRHLIEINSRQAQQFIEHYPDAVLIGQTKSKRRFQVDHWTRLSTELERSERELIEFEQGVFEAAVDRVLDESTTILQSCQRLAQLDVLACFGHLAITHNYVKPRITLKSRTRILAGRHPVVETNLAKHGKAFTMNDCDLERVWLVTGPNMGGKSTFLRQHVIIVLMAHMGCFVPADRASIGLTDRIFSRVGAADNLAQNQSTFMVEMSEVSTILKHATAKSTVIMDEVGRGTSTRDGFSLAFGILDYLHKIKCRTLFATHYHELAEALKEYDHVEFYKTSVEETPNGGYRFTHKIEPGVCKQSHGIKVAQIAGLPTQVIETAEKMWHSLEENPLL